MAESNSRSNGLLERVGNIFPEMLKSMKLGNEFKRRMVIYNWQEIVGRDIAAHAKPVKLEFKRLFIRTTHPAWAEQLKYMEYQLKAKINKYAGEKLVQELVFTNLQPPQVQAVDHVESKKPDVGRELQKIRLSQQELAEIHRDCSHVANKELAASFEKLGQNFLRLRKYRQQIGWQLCQQENCQSQCPPGEKYCQSCQRKLRQARELRLQKLLYDMPWCKYGDIIQEENCTEQEFKAIRSNLIQRLAARVSYGDTTSVDAITLVMLYRSIPPEQLNEQVIQKTLYALRYDLRYVPGMTGKKDKQPKEKEK